MKIYNLKCAVYKFLLKRVFSDFVRKKVLIEINRRSRQIPGLIRTAAYEKAEFLSPDLWHSMTVEVRMGTTGEGNFEMFLATLERFHSKLIEID